MVSLISGIFPPYKGRYMYIFDIDGTLADATHRLHYILNHEGKKIHSPHWDDPPIMSVVVIAKALYIAGKKIILSTGRREDQREMTEHWLYENQIFHNGLFMRPLGDYRSDTVVKPEVLRNFFGRDIPDLVECIFEDRARVTAAWRALGYKVCQVAEGDY
jgi:phosphoglycolate phosphatase-like HAD superfamily hydrolase